MATFSPLSLARQPPNTSGPFAALDTLLGPDEEADEFHPCEQKLDVHFAESQLPGK